MGRIRWRWILAVAASAGIVTTMAGAHGGNPALIHACVHKTSKVVRIVAAGAKCKKSERALDWPAQTAVGAQGIQGPAGPPGVPGAPGQDGDDGVDGADGAPGIVWQGAWAVGTAYEVGDGVFHQGSSYIAIADSTGEAPGAGASWGLLAQRGADGRDGRDGDPGLNWRGEWLDELTIYALNDVVEHNGSSWVFIGEGRAGEPGLSGEWALVAAKGDPGATGVPPAPHQLVVGNILVPWISSPELPIRGLELSSSHRPLLGGSSSFVLEHRLKVTREIDSKSPDFMSSALQGVASQDDLEFRLVAAGQSQPYLRYSDFDGVGITEIAQSARARNLETLTLESAGSPTVDPLGHPSARPPAAGTRVGRLSFGGSTFFDLLSSDWKLTGGSAAEAPPLEVVRRVSDDTPTRFAAFSNRVDYSTVRVELFAPGTTTVAMEYELTDAWIQSWVTAIDGSTNALPTERLTFRYATFKQSAAGTEFCWDFDAADECA